MEVEYLKFGEIETLKITGSLLDKIKNVIRDYFDIVREEPNKIIIWDKLREKLLKEMSETIIYSNQLTSDTIKIFGVEIIWTRRMILLVV